MIGLLDLDNFYSQKWKFPNLALMKISSYYKSLGFETELFKPGREYEKVFISKVFDFTPNINFNIKSKEIYKGGVGFGLDYDNPLPYEIEHIYPDYDLYNIKNVSYGFMSRGCPRDCDFCNVTQHQGSKSIKVSDLKEFWRGQKKIVLLDPNLTLCKEKYKILDELIESKAKIDFSQGLDIRSLTPKFINHLNKLKFDTLHFAWDNYEFNTYEKLKAARPLLKGGRRKYTVYVLINFNTSIDQDLERIYKLKELDYWPYVMIYNTKQASILHKKMQRWVNNRMIWEQNLSYDEYIKSFKNIPKEYYDWKKI